MKKTVNIGIAGLGRRGEKLIKTCLLGMEDVRIVSVCDPLPGRREAIRDLVGGGVRAFADYRDLVRDPQTDAVLIFSPWESHVPIAREALLAGKYTAMEVGTAYDLSDCFSLLAAHEETGAHLMMLENCCYARRELAALRMAREGLFGKIVHCEGAYRHSLLGVDLLRREGEHPDLSHYRLLEYENRNAEEYPTHELGPIAKLLRINRGNRMLTLSSFASSAKGIEAYREKYYPAEAPISAKQGDIVTTVITCAGGETICLTLDTTLPNPVYSRGYTVRGTKGMLGEERRVVYFEGMPECEYNEEEMLARYEHPLFRENLAMGPRGDRDGINWIVLRAFIEAVKAGTEPPIDTYDTLSWMAVGPLSEASIARGGMPVDIPDFTRGQWFRRGPLSGKYSLDEVYEDTEIPLFCDKKTLQKGEQR